MSLCTSCKPSNAAFYAVVPAGATQPAWIVLPAGTFFTPSFMATAIACVISPPGCVSAHKDGEFKNLALGCAWFLCNLVVLFYAFLVSIEAARSGTETVKTRVSALSHCPACGPKTWKPTIFPAGQGRCQDRLEMIGHAIINICYCDQLCAAHFSNISRASNANIGGSGATKTISACKSLQPVGSEPWTAIVNEDFEKCILWSEAISNH